MRTSLILLSSLALAASSQAGVFGTATAITTATMTKDASIVLSGLVGEEVDFSSNFGGNVDGGGAVGETSGSTIHSFDGTTFVMGSMTSATLLADTPGFSQYVAALAYQYDFDLENTDLANPHTVTFDVTYLHTSKAYATGHVYTPSEPYGGYSEGNSEGNLERIDGVADGNDRLTGSATYDFDPANPPVFGPEYSGIKHLTATYTLLAGEKSSFYLYADTDSEVQFVPVPEPSAFAALGLGALGLLRRRRRA